MKYNENNKTIKKKKFHFTFKNICIDLKCWVVTYF